jgi:hypothetical protein
MPRASSGEAVTAAAGAFVCAVAGTYGSTANANPATHT